MKELLVIFLTLSSYFNDLDHRIFAADGVVSINKGQKEVKITLNNLFAVSANLQDIVLALKQFNDLSAYANTPEYWCKTLANFSNKKFTISPIIGQDQGYKVTIVMNYQDIKDLENLGIWSNEGRLSVNLIPEYIFRSDGATEEGNYMIFKTQNQVNFDIIAHRLVYRNAATVTLTPALQKEY